MPGGSSHRAAKVAATAPHGRLVVLPGVGHMLSLEKPAVFEELLSGQQEEHREMAEGACGA